MIIENHKEEVPFSHYCQRFASLEPAEACARLPFIGYENGVFTVVLMGRTYRISHPEYAIETGDGIQPSLPLQTFLLRCLLEAKNVPWQGQWKTFREMPWGELYIKPYTGRVLTRAAFTFGTRLAAFRAAGEKLGALPVPHGDAGFEFEFFGPYRIRVLVWEGDDEFPPNAQILYTDNFAEGFEAEDRVVLCDLLIGHIKAAM